MSFWKQKKSRLSNESGRSGVALIADYDPSARVSEEYRTLRTNILYAKADDPIKTLVFTSDSPSEGKSTVSANTAATFAQQGIRTLLLDADMRRPTIQATFGLQNKFGLVDLLTGEEDEAKLVKACQKTAIENLFVLPAGPIPPNPSELLSSKRMQHILKLVSQAFDLVILDAPPVMSVTDAQIIASRTDATIIVAPYGIAQKNMLLETRNLLEKVHANIIGVVMNRVPEAARRSQYGYYYGSYYTSK
ncbi:CpsD/CapB family tyrosine-protein kinase [Lactobacillus sp. DCY120]|uniref:Tyrosine-protein kinase CpsD n=1 Tax=Bombilactobacillus apium TaxID=2675299 RepID=A0A850R1H7_9LACO|nr:CpsD/CapB family tyrosine-protein kinase [Bombilactobacillus apium]NVY96210.1 CpsD/CapB family tyrosine-protein kinase [Bombilactobacillus apium]